MKKNSNVIIVLMFYDSWEFQNIQKKLENFIKIPKI